MTGFGIGDTRSLCIAQLGKIHPKRVISLADRSANLV